MSERLGAKTTAQQALQGQSLSGKQALDPALIDKVWAQSEQAIRA